MIMDYLTESSKGLFKNRKYLVINISGLAVALAAVIIIALYVFDELGYDQWVADADAVFRIETVSDSAGAITSRYEGTTGVLAPFLQDYFTNELDAVTRVYDYEDIVRYDTVQFGENIHYVDEQFLAVFNLEMLQGSAANMFADPNSIILSETAAARYFGLEEPLGNVLTVDHSPSNSTIDYRVVGVFRDNPANSHLSFNFITRLYEPRYENWPWVMHDWTSADLLTYFKLSPGISIDRIMRAFPDFLQSIPLGEGQDSSRYNFDFVNIQDIHILHEDPPLRSFSLIALLILVMASINYTNLATAHAIERTREVSIRKVVGASRIQLIGQFLGESVITAFFGLVVAMMLIELILPVFNAFLAKNMQFRYLTDFALSAGLVGFTLLVGILGGAYPAFVLSSFRPARTLQSNRYRASGSPLLREGLVVVQFVISVFLITSTLIIYAQLLYSQNLDPGFTRENRLILSGSGTNKVAPASLALKNELLTLPNVESVALSFDTFPSVFGIYTGITLPGSEGSDPAVVKFSRVGPEFLSTYEVDVAAGRLFSPELTSDFVSVPEDQSLPLTAGTIVNRSFTEMAGYDNPADIIGETLVRPLTRDMALTVIGVIEDLQIYSTHRSPVPELYLPVEGGLDYLTLALSQPADARLLERINAVWARHLPEVPISITFADEAYDRLYIEENRRATIFTVFTGLAILIACLGLFGLAAFEAQRRTLEIGIRKVHGASVWSLVRLLLKKFSMPVLLANLVAWPAGYLYMDNWLSNFYFRIDITIGYFLCASCLSLLIAWGVSALHAFRVAMRNPVHALKTQ